MRLGYSVVHLGESHIMWIICAIKKLWDLQEQASTFFWLIPHPNLPSDQR